jgi:uncharacterized protein (TIGR03083 family)
MDSAQPHFFDGQVTTLIEAWSSTIDDISTLAQMLSDDQWALATPCPGWTVGDIVAHVVGVERRLASDSLPDHEPDWSALPHIREDEFTRFMERDVDARRGQPREEVVDELLEVIPRRREQLLSIDPDPDTLVAGPAGMQVPHGRIMRMRVFDLWTHEQDLRRAITQTGNEATIGAHVTADIMLSTLPAIWGKKVGANANQSLRLTVTGGISFECQVIVGEDGRAHFTAVSADPTSSITTDWMTYFALGAGRTTLTEVQDQITLDGDANLATRMLENANIAP